MHRRVRTQVCFIVFNRLSVVNGRGFFLLNDSYICLSCLLSKRKRDALISTRTQAQSSLFEFAWHSVSLAFMRVDDIKAVSLLIELGSRCRCLGQLSQKMKHRTVINWFCQPFFRNMKRTFSHYFKHQSSLHEKDPCRIQITNRIAARSIFSWRSGQAVWVWTTNHDFFVSNAVRLKSI